MKWLIGIPLVLLLLGPLRKPVLYPVARAWMTVLPLVLGWMLGCAMIERFMPGSPAWMRVVGPFFMAVVLGPLGRDFVDAFLENQGRNDG